jgi:D-alanine-D-alanine ligase
MRRLRVAVLMGGPSPEREISLATGRNIMAALDPNRYEVLPVEVLRDGRWQLGAGATANLPAGSSPGSGAPEG